MLLSLATAGAEFRVNQVEARDQFEHDVAMDAEGNFVVVWWASDRYANTQGITGRRFNADGTPNGPDFVVAPAVSPFGPIGVKPTVAMGADGQFVVAWLGGVSSTTDVAVVRAQLYRPDGQPTGGPFDVDPDVDPASISIGSNRDIASAMSDDGRFVIAWRQGELNDPAATGQAVRARLFDAAGQAVGPAFAANSSSAQDPRMSIGAAMDADGDFAISWHNVHIAGSDRTDTVVARRFARDGSSLGNEFRVAVARGEGGNSDVAMDRHGDLVVTWCSQFINPAAVSARLYNTSGQPMGDEFTVYTLDRGSDISFGSVAMDDAGHFLVAWRVDGGDPGTEENWIFARQYDAGGMPLTHVVLLSHSGNPGGSLHADPALNAAGDRAVVVWGRGDQQQPGNDNVYARRLTDLATPDPDPNPDPDPTPDPDPLPTPNTAPVPSAIAPLVATRDAADTVIPLWSYFQDAEDPDSALKLSVAADTNPFLFSGVRINPADGTLTLDYAPGATGTANLTLSATDTGGLSTSTIFTVTVNAPAVPDPVPQPPPQLPTGVPAEPGINAIVGVLFEDADGNGRRSKSEAPLAGVRLFLDADGDGAYEVGETTTTTAADGGYGITNIAPGTYHLRADLPAGRTGGAADVFLPRRPFARPTRVKPLGVSASGSLGGVAFLDANANGLRDPGEPALRRAKVFLDTNGDGVWQKKQERRAKADAAGNFTFANLPGGTYRVALVPRRARAVGTTSAHVLEVTLGEGQARTDLLLGP